MSCPKNTPKPNYVWPLYPSMPYYCTLVAGACPVAQRTEENIPPLLSPTPAPTSAKDDLKRVEGIGPKIEQLLNDAGICTWAQLAAAKVSRLEGILKKAGPRFSIHQPDTWPKQAALAAKGQFKKLEAWQKELKGGK